MHYKCYFQKNQNEIFLNNQNELIINGCEISTLLSGNKNNHVDAKLMKIINHL
jgi:hypothetical protein